MWYRHKSKPLSHLVCTVGSPGGAYKDGLLGFLLGDTAYGVPHFLCDLSSLPIRIESGHWSLWYCWSVFCSIAPLCILWFLSFVFFLGEPFTHSQAFPAPIVILTFHRFFFWYEHSFPPLFCFPMLCDLPSVSLQPSSAVKSSASRRSHPYRFYLVSLWIWTGACHETFITGGRIGSYPPFYFFSWWHVF